MSKYTYTTRYRPPLSMRWVGQQFPRVHGRESTLRSHHILQIVCLHSVCSETTELLVICIKFEIQIA